MFFRHFLPVCLLEKSPVIKSTQSKQTVFIDRIHLSLFDMKAVPDPTLKNTIKKFDNYRWPDLEDKVSVR